MSKGIGRLLQIGIAKETSRGTAIAAMTYAIPFAELDFDDKDQRVIDEQSYGVIESSVSESIVSQWAEGNLKAPIGDKHFPLILYSLLGTLTGTATGSAYTHTITVAQSSQHQSLTFFVDDPLSGQDYKHALSVISELEISYERERFLSYSATIMAKKGATATLTPATVNENRFLPQHLTFKVATGTAGLAAATAIALKSGSLRISQNIEPDNVLGNVAPQDFLTKQFVVEGELEAIWQNESDFKTASLAGTQQAMQLDVVNSAVDLGGGVNPELKITLNKVQFQPIGKIIKLNDIVMQRVAFRAHYHSGDGAMITIAATNAVSSY